MLTCMSAFPFDDGIAFNYCYQACCNDPIVWKADDGRWYATTAAKGDGSGSGVFGYDTIERFYGCL